MNNILKKMEKILKKIKKDQQKDWKRSKQEQKKITKMEKDFRSWKKILKVLKLLFFDNPSKTKSRFRFKEPNQPRLFVPKKSLMVCSNAKIFDLFISVRH